MYEHKNVKVFTLICRVEPLNTVRLPLQSATPPHLVISPMAVRAIPGSTRRRIARRLQNRVQIMF